MHPALVLLEEAITLADQEQQALDNADVDKLEELSSKRQALQNEAWETREGCDENDLLRALKRLHELQQNLENVARDISEDMQKQAFTAKSQRKYFSPYGNRVGAHAPSVIFSKLS